MSNVIILAYADDNENSLKHLKRENQTIYDYLQFKNQGEINVRNLKNASFEDLLKEFAVHKDNIIMFHFSGHAGMAELFFDKQEGVKARGLAALLQMAPKIELVFLNGCATSDQVSILHGDARLQIPPAGDDKGVKRVIATSTKVFDSTAADFAIYFYSALCRYYTVGDAFDYARIFVMAGKKSDLFPEGPARQAGSRYDGDNGSNEFPWGMYYKKIDKQDSIEKYKPLDEYSLPEKASYAQVEGVYKPSVKLVEKIGSKGKIILDNLVKQKKEEGINDTVFDTEIEEFRELHTHYTKYVKGLVKTHHELALRIMIMLPTPLSSLLRPMVTNGIEQPNLTPEGYEELLENQLQFHSTMIKLCSFIMLSDLFNLVEAKQVSMNRVQHKFLIDFFNITSEQSDSFDYVTFIKVLREILDNNTAHPFVQEYIDLKEQENYETSFFDSHMLIQAIRLKKQKGKLGTLLIGYCQSVEDELIKIFERVFFILRYKLLVIRNVEAIRTRTVATKTYKHKIFLLRETFEGYPDELSNVGDYTETYSVIVVKGLNCIIDYLSLSPFVIDKNVLTGDVNSELYFFSHNENGLVFRSVNDFTRKLELQVIESKETITQGNEEVELPSYTIPAVEELTGKDYFEKRIIATRLALIRDQFEYIRKKIQEIEPIDSQHKPTQDNNSGSTSGDKAA